MDSGNDSLCRSQPKLHLQEEAQLAHLSGASWFCFPPVSMTPLKLDPRGLPNGWSDVGPGDAVVAFSRRNIYKARRVSAQPM